MQYVPDKSAFVWKIKQLGGGREFLMRAHFGLPSVRGGAAPLPLSPPSPSTPFPQSSPSFHSPQSHLSLPPLSFFSF